MGADDGWRRMGSNPFAASAVDAVRRLRGRLVAPVTVWTAYDLDGGPAGITVSSMMVAEGEPPSVLGLVGPLSEFWEAASQTGRFVVHVLGADAVRTADQFALRYPGDPFEGLSVTASEWGPVLASAQTRAACSLAGSLDVGYQLLVRGTPVEMELPEDTGPPLVHYRGRYLTTGPRAQGPTAGGS